MTSAEAGVRRLRRTLDQMMTLAHAEAAVDPQDHCDSLRACVQRVLDRLPAAQQERVSLQWRGDDRPCALPNSMLETAVRNLVDNALKYSSDHLPVEVTVQAESHLPNFRILVADRGPGLDDAQSAQLGRRFWRGDHGRHSQDGAGLGISIVRAVAGRFGGTLTFHARDGGGLEAVLSLSCKEHR